MNRLGHGLRSPELVLPTEDPAAFQAHMDAWMDDFGSPRTMAQRELKSRKMALAAWRRKRVVRVEAQRLSERVNAAFKDFDRRERAACLQAGRQDAPGRPGARGLAALRATRAGVEKLIAMWSEIAPRRRWPSRRQRLYGDVHHEAPDRPAGAEGGRRGRGGRRRGRGVVAAPAPRPAGHRPRPLRPLDGRGGPRRSASGSATSADEAASTASEALRDLAPPTALLGAGPPRRGRAPSGPRPEDAPLLRYEGQLDREFHRGLAALTKLVKSDADPTSRTPRRPTRGAPASSETSDITTDDGQQVPKPHWVRSAPGAGTPAGTSPAAGVGRPGATASRPPRGPSRAVRGRSNS